MANGFYEVIFGSQRGAEMEVAIVTCLRTKGDMDIYSGQERLLYATKLSKTLRTAAACLLVWSIICVGAVGTVQAQGYAIRLQPQDPVASQALSTLDDTRRYDSLQAVQALQQLLAGLYASGYVQASMANLVWRGDSVCGSLEAGTRMFLKVKKEGSEKAISWSGFRSGQSFRKDLEKHLNDGYPFARLYFETASMANDTLSAVLAVERGPLIVFDSLHVTGAGKTRPIFLQKLLFINPGTPYSEKTFQGIASRVGSSGFLRLTAAPRVEFYDGKAGVRLELEELQVNQIDGIIGFLPDQNNETGRLLVTGQVEADLNNLFGTGKQIYFNWENFNVSSQKLIVAYNHPVLLGSPLDFDGSFQQLKQDSSFVSRTIHTGFALPLSGCWKLGFGVDFRRNSLLSPGNLQGAERLLSADSRLNQYAVGVNYTRLNDILLPTHGIDAAIKFGVGQKEIIKNASVNQDLYNEILLKTLQITSEARIQNFTPLFKSSVFVQQLFAGSIVNREVFTNDLFRFGGLDRLRGFNQNQFFAQHYGIGVLEWRFLFQKESYFVSFVDQAAIALDNNRWLYALGLGGGMVLRVNNGLFRLMLAVGGNGNQPIDLTQPKIHFGFTNRF